MNTKPEYIYRLGNRAKDLALTREADYLTGLSFQDEPVGRHFLTLSVENLEKNGFIVRPDAGERINNIWTGEAWIEPNSGESWYFGEGHVSVWHADKLYWDQWYEADKKLKGKPEISEELTFFAQSIVKGGTTS